MLIEQCLPAFDVTEVCEKDVDASAAETYGAIRVADLRCPVVNAPVALRQIPLRIGRARRRESPASPVRPVLPGTIAGGGFHWTRLAEEPDVEVVLGAVGRFWQHDHDGRPITREEFVPFQEPGYAKVALSLSLRPSPSGRTIIRYEARTATTDAAAERTFRRYWRLIHEDVHACMEGALERIKAEAERHVLTVS
ncbi:MAG: hypothetical protein HY700_10125 [Gemmatimonadetes bacterium]|nr:hypothetical protein [Gemmatimonadota bacterium]